MQKKRFYLDYYENVKYVGSIIDNSTILSDEIIHTVPIKQFQ